MSEKIKLIFKDQYDEFDTISMKYDFHPTNINISNIEWVDYSKKYINKSQLVNDIDIKAVKPSKLKIGQYVQHTFREAFNQGLISNDEIQNLQDSEYSKTNFNANFEVLRLKSRTIKDVNGNNRYYSREFFCGNYYLTSQWIEPQWNLYLKWLNKIGYNNLISTPLLDPLK